MRPTASVSAGGAHDAEIAGIDALEIPIEAHPPLLQRVWRATWPVVAALAAFLAIWQIAYVFEVRPHAALPGPASVFAELRTYISTGVVWKELQTTSLRAMTGYGAAMVIGVIVGLAVVGSKVLRTAAGSFVTGLQTMPSIAWFPLAIILFGLNESAILFVMILGAAPAIANGLIAAVDQIPPILLSAGRVLGASGVKRFRYVVIPASMPSFVGGMKQGWAFLWRSLLAGELLVVIRGKLSLGQGLQIARELADAEGLIARMIVVLALGIVVDRLFFARLDGAIRIRWGLSQQA